MKIRIASTITVIVSILAFICFDSSAVSAEATMNDVQTALPNTFISKYLPQEIGTYQVWRKFGNKTTNSRIFFL